MGISRSKQFELDFQRQFALERVETILDESPPVLREKLEWIRSCFEDEWRRSVQGRYQIAVAIREIYEDVTEHNGSVYGAKAVEALKKAFEWDDGVIYQTLHVADAFTPEQIEAMTEMRLPGGRPLSFSHVVSLASVEDDRQRDKLLKRAVKEGWTARKLANAASPSASSEPGKRQDRRGRPFARPRDFDAVLDQQADFARDFLSRDAQVWSHPGHSLSAKAGDLDPADVTPERRDLLKEHARLLTLLAERAKERADEATRTHDYLTQVLEQQDARCQKLGGPATASRAESPA
jgi:hypothetical protein